MPFVLQEFGIAMMVLVFFFCSPADAGASAVVAVSLMAVFHPNSSIVGQARKYVNSWTKKLSNVPP